MRDAAWSSTAPQNSRAKPAKVKIKVAGSRHKAPYAADLPAGTVVKLKAPRFTTVKGVRYAFVKWQGVKGKKSKKLKLSLTLGTAAVTVKAVYKKVRR